MDRGVSVKKGESVDRVLKRLKTKLDTEGILEEIRRRRAFENTNDRKRRKARSAPKRNKLRWRYVTETEDKRNEAARQEKLAAASTRS